MEAEAAAEEALNQIEEKGYATRFIVSGKTTLKIGRPLKKVSNFKA